MDGTAAGAGVGSGRDAHPQKQRDTTTTTRYPAVCDRISNGPCVDERERTVCSIVLVIAGPVQQSLLTCDPLADVERSGGDSAEHNRDPNQHEEDEAVAPCGECRETVRAVVLTGDAKRAAHELE